MPDPDNAGTTAPDNSGSEEVSVVNTDGSFAENWSASYGDEASKTLGRYKTLPDLVNSHVSLRKKLGKDPDSLVVMPNKKSSKETWASFHERRGVPKDITGYEFKKSDKISERVLLDESRVDNFKNIAKKWDFTPRQFNGAVNDYLEAVGVDMDTFETGMEENKLTRAKEGNDLWNQEFKGEAAARKVAANAVLDTYGLDPIKMPDGTETSIKGELFKENPNLLQSVWMLRLMDKVRSALSEDTLQIGSKTSGPTMESVDSKIAEVREEMSKIQKENPGNYKWNQKYKQLAEEKHGLYKTRPAS